MAAAAVIFLQHTSGILFNKTIDIPVEIMQPAEGGAAFSASNRWLNKELQRLHSQAAVMDNGVSLPFPTRVSEDVRSGEPGHYAFSRKNVWFSSSDGSDPRTNGRRYTVWFPNLVSPATVAVAWLCLGAGVVLVIRARFGVWVWTWWRR